MTAVTDVFDVGADDVFDVGADDVFDVGADLQPFRIPVRAVEFRYRSLAVTALQLIGPESSL